MTHGSNASRNSQALPSMDASKPKGSFQEGSRYTRGEGNRVASRPSASTQRRTHSGKATTNPYLAAEKTNRAFRKTKGSHVYTGSERYHSASPLLSQPIITNQAQGYQTRAPHQKPYKRPHRAPVVIAIVAVLCVVAGGIWFWWSNSSITVTVNGTEANVRRNTTVAELVEAGYASPTPGNLLAIDGSLLSEGDGEPFRATVDGTVVATQYAVADGNVVEVADGGDLTEEATTEQVAIPHGSGGNIPTGFPPVAIHTYTEGQDGVMERVTGTQSGIVQESVVSEPIDGGYVQYNADTGDDKVVALTFDDGPWPDSTEQILDILKENDAKATFFTIGEQIAEYGEGTKRAAAEGHQICTHSYDHASGSGQGVNLTYMSPEEQIAEIQKGYEAISSATGQEASKIIRAPGGNFYGDLVGTLEPYIKADIGWNIDTEDWSRPGVDAIVSAIESAEPGDVILMHDGGGDRSQTVEALRIALPYLKEQGYRFVTVDELLAYPIPTSGDGE